MEGPTKEKLVEEVKYATVESIADREVLKMEFSELRHKVEKPTE